MRNAAIRKKRLKAERVGDEFVRMPQGTIVPTFNISGKTDLTPEQVAAAVASRQGLWAS